MIRFDNVSRTFGDTTVLHPIDLSVTEKRTCVLLGQSGCGKSTLLRLIVGLIPPSSGRVLIDGIPVTPDTATELRRRIGYVIQDGGLFPHLTAHENIALMARQIGWNRDRINARVDELQALTHFPPDALNRYPLQMSGGQRQRVSLMRALMLNPDVLLLDEPLGALDPMIRSDMQTELRAIFRRLEKTVVMVTHDLAEAAFFGDVIVLLRDGHLVQRGSIDQLEQSPADPFVTAFITAQRAIHA